MVGARTLISVAQAEYDGAENAAQLVFNGSYSASIHLLIGFAFELILKSAYLAAGGSQAQLRAIGHDLVCALDEAESAGFRFNHPKLRWVVEHLREAHLNHAFRYGWRVTLSLPEFGDSIPVAEHIAELVRLQLPD